MAGKVTVKLSREAFERLVTSGNIEVELLVSDADPQADNVPVRRRAPPPPKRVSKGTQR